MVLKRYLDSNSRSSVWRALGCDDWSFDEKLEEASVFLLIHTRDVQDRMKKSGTLAGFEALVRADCGQQTAILYISGLDDPWEHFQGIPGLERPSHSTPWSYLHKHKVDHTSRGFDDFRARLTRLLQTWEEAGATEPPKWDLLERDWAWEVSDAISCALLNAPGSGGAARPAALSQLQKLLSAPEVGAGVRRLREDGGEAWTIVERLLDRLYRSNELVADLRKDLEFALGSLRAEPAQGADSTGPSQHEEFMKLRGRVHHNHFQNDLIVSLGPGWSADERGTESDVVLRAARGDEASVSHCKEVLRLWKSTGSPQLARLLELGEQLAEPRAELERIRAADVTLRRLFPEPSRQETPQARAAAFWRACDVIEGFLSERREPKLDGGS